MRIQDKGSIPREVLVDVQGVPATGVIDSGADITIMGAELFKQVASVARLKKSAFKKPDKTPYAYGHQPFSLDGKLELDITFDNHTMRTPVYIKMDARDPLLLSEGVCHQLGIIKYHPQVGAAPPATSCTQRNAYVPVVRVKTSVRDLAAQASRRSQERYKRNHDRHATYTNKPVRVGDWVLVNMPRVKSGWQRKLSQPWHGPFCIVSISNSDVLLMKIYFPHDRTIQVHQSRIKVCPPRFPSGFYWYGSKRRGPGRPPRCVTEILESYSEDLDPTASQPEPSTSTTTTASDTVESEAWSGSQSETTPQSVTILPTDEVRPACKYPLRNRRSGRT